jgi:D-aminoacyl-tRNA deacylase
MRALIQRVTKAGIANSSEPDQQFAAIKKGLLILVGFEETDTRVGIEQMVQKVKSLRVFSDSDGKMNLAGGEVDAEYLLVSQFTLYADCKYGNRPSFVKAAPKAKALELYGIFVSTCQRLLGSEKVKNGVFGSNLAVSLVNDGPVTIWLDSQSVF